jgi:putative endopeptidase
MAREKMPENESRWGTFMILRKQVDEQIHTLVKNLAKKKPKKGSLEGMIHDLLVSGMDMKLRNKLGLTPISKHLALIDSIKTQADIVPTIAKLEKMGAGGVWSAFVDQDMKDSERYLFQLAQGGLGMPDRDYYLKNDADSMRVRDAYKKHLARLVELAKLAQDSEKESARVFALEQALAKASMSKEERQDPDKTYHPYSLTKLIRETPRIGWRKYLRIVGVKKVTRVNVVQPKFFTALNKLIQRVPIEDWRAYLRLHLVNDFAGALTEEYVQENFAFYGTVLSGAKEMKPLWRRVLSTVQSAFGEAVGRLYVEKYFPPNAKKATLEMVGDLLTAYEKRIKELDWMSGATKEQALTKLKKITVKIGYPDKWETYAGLTIAPDDFIGNIIRAGEWHSKKELKKLQKKKVDRKEWHMYPHTVNAYYSPSMNDIVFPAGILQPPFFDTSADDAINYGAIGSVIGHEITHAFDDQGSKFDGVGNRRTWWKKEDKKKFEKKGKVLVNQFNTYTVADGIPVNGKLTLGENIADLGGMSIGFDAYLLKLGRTKREDIDGFTSEQRYFLGASLFEREMHRSEFIKMQVKTDTHSPSEFRINGPVSNLPEFYKAFNVQKGDALYRKPKDRAKIW